MGENEKSKSRLAFLFKFLLLFQVNMFVRFVDFLQFNFFCLCTFPIEFVIFRLS